MVQKASPKLTEMMNQAIAGELQAIVQYMWHHIMVKGLNSASLMDVFEEIAVEEMKHAEKIAERLFYFDVAPTTKPNPIAKGGTPEQMLKADVQGRRRGDHPLQGHHQTGCCRKGRDHAAVVRADPFRRRAPSRYVHDAAGSISAHA